MDDKVSKQATVNFHAGGLENLGDKVSVNPGFALVKLDAINTQNSVPLLSYWTDCSAAPTCAAGYYLWTYGHGKVYDSDRGAYAADGCHGGGNGYNRALCVQSDVLGYGCQWYGKPKGCGQTCPPGHILMGQNTHIGGAKTGCKSGHFSSYCCREIIASRDYSCPNTNANNLLTGGQGVLGPLVARYKDDPTLDTALGDLLSCFISVIFFMGLVGTARYIPNIIPGHFERYRGFVPINNVAYTTEAEKPCTATVTTHTEVKSVTSSPKTITCDGSRYPQACAHYSSVMSRQGHSTFPCPLTQIGRSVPQQWDKEHHKSWLLWVPNFPKNLGENKCNPAGSPYQQYLRFLPESQNKGAGQYWKNLCKHTKKETKTEGGPIEDQTCTEIVSTIYTVNAMVMDFTKVNGDLIDDNPCLPIITDDPGFALLWDDPWYKTNKQHKTLDYKFEPDKDLVSGKTTPRKKPAKRWADGDIDTADLLLDLLTDVPTPGYVPTLPLNFDPEDLIVDKGNSSRRATPEELYESLGLIKCTSPNCEEERQALGQSTNSQMSITHLAHATPTSILPTDTRQSLLSLHQPVETGSLNHHAHHHHTLGGH
ncbi:hypothetical protein BDW75DRAFT_235461 [Aspergillus navahoensis]